MSRLDLDTLRQIARSELMHLLEETPGCKDVVIEEELLKPLDRVAGMSVLKQHGAEKIFRFEAGKALGWGPGVRHRLYLLRPSVANAKAVVEHVVAERHSADKAAFTVVFVPRRLGVCDSVFEAAGVWSELALRDFDPGFIQLEPRLLSLELPSFAGSWYLDGSRTWIQTAAKALWSLQSIFGPIPRVHGIGHAAAAVSRMLDSLDFDLGEAKPTADQPFSHLIILDRAIDWVTPLLSCVSYEALLDDAFGIKCGYIEFGSEVTKSEKTLKHVLSKPGEDDAVYDAIRDLHFSQLSNSLSSKAKELKATADKRNESSEVSHLKNFVANDLRVINAQRRSLQLHIGAAEVIIQRKTKANFEELLGHERNLIYGDDVKKSTAYIEDCMCQQLPENQVLSLLCLLSLTQNGLGGKDYQSLKTQFMHAYGFRFIPAFQNLRRMGLLTEKDRATASIGSAQISLPPELARGRGGSPSHAGLPSFATMAKKLRLVPEEGEGRAEMAYLFNGAFVPALCRLVEGVLRDGFAKEELSRTFQCPLTTKDSSAFPGNRPAEPRTERWVLVFFLGGVSRAELAALRVLEARTGLRILVATTNVIRRDDFLRHICLGGDTRRGQDAFRSGKKVSALQKPELFAGSKVASLVAQCGVASEVERPPFLCPWGMIQTALRAAVSPSPSLPYEREVLTMDDDGQVGLDWLPPAANPSDDTPIVLLLPGLTGSSEDNYVTSLVDIFRRANYRTVVFNNRGNGGVELLTTQTYSAAYTGDIVQVVHHVNKKYPDAKVLALGFSLGGMIVYNYVAMCGDRGQATGLAGALAISSPWNPHESTASLERFWPRVLFNRRLARLLTEIAGRNRATLGHLIPDWDELMASATVREFDERFIVPLFGYKDVWEYYHDAALHTKAHHIPVPTLCLNARDDPFAPVDSIPLASVPDNENLGVLVTQHGGHIAFLRSLRTAEPSLVHLLALQFADALLRA